MNSTVRASAAALPRKTSSPSEAVIPRAVASTAATTAMAMLRSKLLELEERKRQEELARERGETQSAEWGNQIRSYVLHPYTMVKDHRTDHEMGDTARVLDGDLDDFIQAFLRYKAEQRHKKK